MQASFDVEEGKDDILCHLIMQEINLMGDDIKEH